MFDHMFENLRRISESSLQMQHEALQYWVQPWTAVSAPAGASAESTRNAQRQWGDLLVDMLNRQRESLDAAWKTGIQIVEQTVRSTDAGAQQPAQE